MNIIYCLFALSQQQSDYFVLEPSKVYIKKNFKLLSWVIIIVISRIWNDVLLSAQGKHTSLRSKNKMTNNKKTL